ncbi:putative two-component system response regulator [Devosia crocina]|uniref:Putative two-component system response regulator n=1 Tax=Devosia crocina TaxID=429728 RepID=A0A1I7NVC0_9HYPH|nr:HD domain-containing phosphohydrolase [Devosia crocina]SFV38580.1 putative two-component system response regulator [Devosia crocina]
MRVVIVEDNRTNLEVLTQLVRRMPSIAVEGFTEGASALADAQCHACDLMIIDNVMPGMSGLELVEAVRSLPSHRHVPIVMITADADRLTRLAAINAGATDFLAKPVDPIELRSRLTNLLALRSAQNQLEDRAVHLEAEVNRATAHLQQREEDMIYRLARAIEVRDHETGDHVERVARVAGILATAMGFDADFVRTLWLAAPLHDVGKIGVSDAILNKPGRLEGPELERMRMHPIIGAEILADGDSDMLRMAEQIARCHHEKWDGSGYPHGLAGEQIPIAARITSVADVLDALCSPRSYKPAWSASEAFEEILRSSGTHFDPECVSALEHAWAQIVPIYTPRFDAVDAA